MNQLCPICNFRFVLLSFPPPKETFVGRLQRESRRYMIWELKKSELYMLQKKLSNNLTISLIPASKLDFDQIYELEKRIFAENECVSKAQLRYYISSPSATFFMLFDNKSGVGYGIALRNKLRNGQYKGRIYSIGVLPEYRSAGAGSFFLEAMEKYLIESGVSFIVLETVEGRDGAKLFFLKQGYTESKFLPNYYPYGDGMRMKKMVAEKSKPTKSI